VPIAMRTIPRRILIARRAVRIRRRASTTASALTGVLFHRPAPAILTPPTLPRSWRRTAPTSGSSVRIATTQTPFPILTGATAARIRRPRSTIRIRPTGAGFPPKVRITLMLQRHHCCSGSDLTFCDFGLCIGTPTRACRWGGYSSQDLVIR